MCKLIIAAFAVGASIVCAQPLTDPTPPLRLPPPPPSAEELSNFKVSSEVDVVLLDVSVKDGDGGWASNLQKDNFKVFENGREQMLTIFGAQDAPVTVGLVVDNSHSVRNKRPEIVTAALTFATRSNPKDEMFVVNFNDFVKLGLPEGVPFTDDTKLLRTAMLSNPVQGRTALYDALKKALQHLDGGRRDKKTLVVISDGGDTASETTEDEIIRLAEESLATIYTVGIFDPQAKDKNPGFLKKLANITGGEAYMPDNTGELVEICEKIAHDIRNRYTIGYTPDNREFDGKVRRLKVLASAADRGKLTVRTRTHYIPPGGEMAQNQKKRK